MYLGSSAKDSQRTSILHRQGESDLARYAYERGGLIIAEPTIYLMHMHRITLTASHASHSTGRD